MERESNKEPGIPEEERPPSSTSLKTLLNAFLHKALATIGDKKASELTEQEVNRIQLASLSALGFCSGDAVEAAVVHLPALDRTMIPSPAGTVQQPRATGSVGKSAVKSICTLTTGAAEGGKGEASHRTLSERPTYQLVFSHQCEYLGCADRECLLCRSNPNRRCTTHFDSRYYVSNRSRAKCGGAIMVDLVDVDTGANVGDLPYVLHGRAVVLDTELYSQTKSTVASMLTQSNKNEPLLKEIVDKDKGGDVHCEALELVFQSSGGRTYAMIPPFAFMASSESVLGGKKNLFSLCCVVDSIEMPGTELSDRSLSSMEGSLGKSGVVEALGGAMGVWGPQGGPPPLVIDPKDIAPVVSTPFVVASRRLKKASKSNIPFVSDPLLKLKHMGKTAVKKLESLGAYVHNLPKMLEKVENVGQFKALVQLANNDKQLRDNLLNVLKITDAKWEEVCEQALRCVQKDNRVRVWCPNNMMRDGLRVGFLFACDCGSPDLSMPIGMYSFSASSHPQTSNMQENRGRDMHLAYKINHEDLRLMDFINSQKEAYLTAWREPGHPAWQIGDLETDRFLKNRDQCMLFRPISTASGVLQRFPSDPLTTGTDQLPTSAFAPGGSWNESLRIGSGIMQDILQHQLEKDPPLMTYRPGSAIAKPGLTQPVLSEDLDRALSGVLRDNASSEEIERVMAEALKDRHPGLAAADASHGKNGQNGDGRAPARHESATGTNGSSRPNSADHALASVLNCPMWQSDELDSSIARQLSIDHMLNSSNSFPVPSLTPTSNGTLDQLFANLNGGGRNLDNRIPSVNQTVAKMKSDHDRKTGATTTTTATTEKNESRQQAKEMLTAVPSDGLPALVDTVHKQPRSLALKERIDSSKVIPPVKRRRRTDHSH